jgi:hypothetical protein
LDFAICHDDAVLKIYEEHFAVSYLTRVFLCRRFKKLARRASAPVHESLHAGQIALMKAVAATIGLCFF